MEILKRIKLSIAIRRHNKELKREICMNGGVLGPNVRISLIGGGNFICGKNVKILSSGIEMFDSCRIAVLPGATLTIGDNTGMSQVSITCKDSIKIGSHVTIGAGTMIFDTNFHNTDWRVRRTKEDLKTARTAPVVINDDCFIGVRTIICKGVTIGSRSVIAAGSVVVSDIPNDCVAGGNPCRIIKYLKHEKSTLHRLVYNSQ